MSEKKDYGYQPVRKGYSGVSLTEAELSNPPQGGTGESAGNSGTSGTSRTSDKS